MNTTTEKKSSYSFFFSSYSSYSSLYTYSDQKHTETVQNSFLYQTQSSLSCQNILSCQYILSQQQQFLISVLIQFVSYTQQNFIISKISVFQKSLFTETSFTSFIFTSLTVVQQSILYMSVSVFKSAEFLILTEQTLLTFSRHKKSSFKIITLMSNL